MLKIPTPVLPSVNQEKTISFYTGKMGFTFHSHYNGHLIFAGMDLLSIFGIVRILRKVKMQVVIFM